MEEANTYHVNIPLMIMAFVGYGVNIKKISWTTSKKNPTE
jgi:hypothetical protein